MKTVQKEIAKQGKIWYSKKSSYLGFIDAEKCGRLMFGKGKEMADIIMREIKTELELKEVLKLCYRILGTDNEELYGYEA